MPDTSWNNMSTFRSIWIEGPRVRRLAKTLPLKQGLARTLLLNQVTLPMIQYFVQDKQVMQVC